MYVLFADFFIHCGGSYRLKKYINLCTNEVHITVTDDETSYKYHNSLVCALMPMRQTPEFITSFMLNGNKLEKIEVEFDDCPRRFKHCNSTSVYAINMLSREELVLLPSSSVVDYETWKKGYSTSWYKPQTVQQFIDEFNKIGENPKERQDMFSKMAEGRLDGLETQVNTFVSCQEKHAKCVDKRLDTLEHQIKNSAFNHNKLSKSMFKEFANTEVAFDNHQSRIEYQDKAIKQLEGLLAETKRDVHSLKIALLSICAIGFSCIGIVISFNRATIM